MKILKFPIVMILTAAFLNGCMSREEAAKYVTITLIQSPEATLAEWHAVTVNQAPQTQRFESPLGSIELTRTPTELKAISQPEVSAVFSALKQKIEQQMISAHQNLINPADDDLLQLADHDFLHTTYRIRDQNNQRQRIELFLAPINKQLMTIDVRIGDDADMRSYSELQNFLTQQVTLISQNKTH